MSALVQLMAFGLGIVLPHWLIEADEKRLTSAERARAWPRSSHWAAILAFSWLAVPVHCIKTRRSWGGVLRALVMLAVGIAIQFLMLTAAELLLAEF